ncbi:outer membrane beta-barrel protein [Roseateles oligotrophus]|uniref:Outer membrane beta-barrel protein n=1 Tax=Roseateles oligotrophus TaxID=1769250 RepID=A0ABT2YA67_9BURK|nr:outer membrane beta-barrel protein [Roseateles oligotrophus]MCV2366945.1 outer membrane beta-barrel protein [Roseateles oligotrophus]
MQIKNQLILALFAAAAACSGGASAQSYLGANLSVAVTTDSSCDKSSSNSNNNNFRDCSFKTRLGGKFYGGHLFDKVGVEIMTFGLGSTSTNLSKGESRFDGVGGEALYAVLPLRMERVMLKGKLGVAHVRGGLVRFEKDKTEYKSSAQVLVGATASVLLGTHWALNADWDRIPAKFVDGKSVVNMLSLGASYSF